MAALFRQPSIGRDRKPGSPFFAGGNRIIRSMGPDRDLGAKTAFPARPARIGNRVEARGGGPWRTGSVFTIPASRNVSSSRRKRSHVTVLRAAGGRGWVGLCRHAGRPGFRTDKRVRRIEPVRGRHGAQNISGRDFGGRQKKVELSKHVAQSAYRCGGRLCHQKPPKRQLGGLIFRARCGVRTKRTSRRASLGTGRPISRPFVAFDDFSKGK